MEMLKKQGVGEEKEKRKKEKWEESEVKGG